MSALKKFLFLLLFLCSFTTLFSQLGDTHYIPPLHGRITTGQDINTASVYLSTPFPNPIEVTISLPNGTLLGTRTISEGNAASFNVANFITVAANELNTPLSNKGVIVSAPELIFVSLRVQASQRKHAGHLTAKGDDAFGSRFRIGSSTLQANVNTQNFFTSFMAINDNTIITVSDYNPNVVFEPNITDDQLSITLDAGETYTISGYESAPNTNGFIGALVTTQDSDHPIVVNTGNINANDDAVSTTSSDIMIDQIVDESLVGDEYLLVRGNGNNVLEKILVIASVPNTEISINGNLQFTLANPGDFQFITDNSLYLPNTNVEHRNMYINSGDQKAFHVYQFIGGSDDSDGNGFPDATPGMMFIPPLSCFYQRDVNLIPAVDEVSPTEDGYSGAAFIVTTTGSTITVNGAQLPPGAALTNPGTTEWVTYRGPDVTGDLNVSSTGPLALGLIGFNDSAGFGAYYSGFAAEPEDTTTEICTGGDPIDLLARFDGNVPDGGTWTPSLDSGTNIFDPVTDPLSNPSLIYRYQAIGDCDPVDIFMTIVLVNTPLLDNIPDVDTCTAYSLPDPTTLGGNFLINPQYFTGPQSDPTAIILDWTIPITTNTTVWVYDVNEADPENCPIEISFDITLGAGVTAGAVSDYRLCEDPATPGNATFELVTVTTPDILNGQNAADFNITWHALLSQAEAGTPVLPNPNALLSGSRIIYARLEDKTDVTCYDTTPIRLFADDAPIARPDINFSICGSGSVFINLTNFNSAVFNGQSTTTFSISYHDDAAEAAIGGVEIINPELTNYEVNGTTTVYARLENQNNDLCAAVITLNLAVETQATALDPGTFFQCSDNLDFFLDTQDATILGGQDPALYSVTYHDTGAIAIAGGMELSTPYTYDALNVDIWARVTNNADPSCFNTVQFDLALTMLPVVTTPVSFEKCSPSGDPITVFDLTTKEADISMNSVNETFAFSINGMPIADPVNYTNTAQSETIDVVINPQNGGCSEVAQIELFVETGNIPAGIIPLEQCVAQGEIMAEFDLLQTEAFFQSLFMFPAPVEVTYYESEVEARAGVDFITTPAAYESDPTLANPVTGIQNIWVRVDEMGTTDCPKIGLHIRLRLLYIPEPNPTPDPFEVCDSDGDMMATFNLTDWDTEVLGNLIQADHSVIWFANQTDVDTGIPIPDQTAFVSTSTTVIAVVTDTAQTTVTSLFCNSQVTVQLRVTQTPGAVTPQPYERCDDAVSGSETDGIATFDLRSRDAEIINGNAALQVTYHPEMVDAEMGAAALPDMYPNEDVETEIIWARVEDSGSSCFAVVPLTLVVNKLPFILEPLTNLTRCDADGNGTESFDLQNYANDLLATLTNVDLNFYEDPLFTSPIDITIPYNVMGTRLIFIDAQDTDPMTTTSCNKMYTFNLVVQGNPQIPAMLSTLAVCDIDNSGNEPIDLTQNEADIYGTQDQTLLKLTYHETLASADAIPGSALDTPISDADLATYDAVQLTPNQTIYIRLEVDDGTTNTCVATGSFDIRVDNGLIIPVTPADLVQAKCDENTDNVELFNLRLDEDALTGMDATLDVTYYASQADFVADVEITDPANYENDPTLGNPQLIVVTVTNAAGCESRIDFEIHVLPFPMTNNNPGPLEACDDPTSGSDIDGFSIFTDAELQARANFIAAGQPVAIFSDFAQADTETPDFTNAINLLDGIDDFSNTATVTEIYIRVERIPQPTDPPSAPLCYVIVPVPLEVNSLPVLGNFPDPFQICEDYDGTPTTTLIDLDEFRDELMILEPPQDIFDFLITFYTDQAEAESDIDSPPSELGNTYEITDGETLYIRIKYFDSSCRRNTQVTVNVSSKPPLNDAAVDLSVCADTVGVNEVPTTPVSIFDFTDNTTAIINNVPDLDVEYYESMEQAENGEFIPNPSTYQNISNPQTIYYRAVTPSSNCQNDALFDFQIEVRDIPYVALDELEGVICVSPNSGNVIDPFVVDGTVDNELLGVDYSYEWRLDGGLASREATVLIDAPGTYDLFTTATYTDASGALTACEYRAQAIYTPESAPTFQAKVAEGSFTPSGTYTVDVINISGFGDGPYEFSLDGGSYQIETTFFNVSPGEHTIFGRLVGGNCTVNQFQISIIDYPRYFTPNSDGFHDTWNIIGLDSALNADAKIFIFDRYGKLLKQLRPGGAGWNGTYNGRTMPSSDYWFRLEYTEAEASRAPREIVGHFTLKR